MNRFIIHFLLIIIVASAGCFVVEMTNPEGGVSYGIASGGFGYLFVVIFYLIIGYVDHILDNKK